MALTREIFLFFITNSFGQCYYMDQYGKVQTCPPGDPNSWLDQAPHGWEDQQIGYGRNTKYWGLNRSYSQPLKFVNDGATILRYLLYSKRGSEEQAYLVVNKYNGETDTYESYYKGEIDLMNNVDDVPLEGISVNIIEGGLLKIFKAYENTVFQIPCDGSIPENLQVDMSGLLFNAVFTYSTVPSQIIWKGTIIPMVFLSQQGSEVGAIGGEQEVQTFDPQNAAAFNAILTGGTNYLFYNSRSLNNVKIKGSIKITGSLNNACLVAWTSLNNFYPLINIITANRIPSGALTGAQPYNVDVTIPTLAAGETIYLMLITLNGDGDGSVNFGANNLSITFDSHFTDSVVYAIKPYDLLSLLLKKICENAFVYPENKVYELQSNLLNQHSNLVLTSGSALRKESGAVIKTSLSEFFEAFDSQLSACMGNTPSTLSPGEVLFFEKLDYTLDSSKVAMDLGEVTKLKIKPATDLHFDLLKIGYNEQKYDEKQGNNEWNTTAQYKAPVKKVNKELCKVSPYRADAYGIEYTRTLIPTSHSTNNKSDNDTFILNIDYSNTSSAQAIVNGMQGTYYGSGVTLPDASQGLNRGRQMAIESVAGSGIASSFSVSSTHSPDDTLRYLGGNTNVFASIQLKFSFRGDLSIHYYNHANIFGPNKQKQALLPGVYYATFNIRFNGNVIHSQPLTLNGGKVDSFTVTKTLSNTPLKYADNFQFEIYYSTRDPRILNNTIEGDDLNGYLLVFNIDAFTVVIADSASVPVYGLTKKSYSASTLPNADSAYNIEEVSPARLVRKHAGYIKSILLNQLDRDLVFQVADKNHNLSTTLNGITITEGANIPLGTLLGEIMFRPFYFEFSTKVPLNFIDLVNSSANNHIKFSYCGNEFYGFPMDVKVKPALEDVQDWKLLCSPVVDLNSLIDLEYTGIDNIDLMKYNIATPHLSPVKFVPLGFIPTEKYNFLHIDQDWFINQVGFWPFKENYFQKWQKNDTLELQCITNAIGPVVADVIDSTGKVIDSFSYSVVTDDAVKSPLILWQASYNLSDLEEGVYYIKLTAGTGATTSVMISEGLHIAEKWPVTLLFEYSSTRNRQATVFSSGYAPSFRVEAWIDDHMPNSKYSIYEDQPANLEMLNAIPYMNCTLNIGADGGVPAWVIRLVDRILLLNKVKIDGVGYTREQDAKWDRIDVPSWPMKYYKIQLRESENNDFVSVYADGELDDKLTVIYNIDTNAFGDGTDSSGKVQVTKITK